MHDELTAQDIEQMRAELRQRKTVLLPQLIKAVQEARAFGDLSENFEYKAAKQELNACKRRIRYLEGMISGSSATTPATTRWVCLTRSPCAFPAWGIGRWSTSW